MRAALTPARLREVLSYDAVTGDFVWRVSLSNKSPVGAIAGTKTKRGCLVIGIDRKQHKAHHLAFLYMTGEWPVLEVDHRDTDPTNNRWANLRQVSHQHNAQNARRARVTSKTGTLGVHLCKQTGRYRASITVSGKCKQLGRFDTAEQAHMAYVTAKRQVHAGCTL